jgi:hypothetical protein
MSRSPLAIPMRMNGRLGEPDAPFRGRFMRRMHHRSAEQASGATRPLVHSPQNRQGPQP